MKKALGCLGVGLLAVALLVKPVSGQDLTTQLAKFLVDLRAGALGVNQPITSTTLTTVQGATGSALTVSAASGQTLRLGNLDGVPITLSGTSIVVGTVLWNSTTAPTISSGFGTSPSIASSSGTASFRVNVGTGGAASTGVVGMPAATTGWNCQVTDSGPGAIDATRETASTTTTVTVGAAAAWTASDILIFNCSAF